MERLVLGDEHEARLTARVRTVQAPGGCGALRLGAELIRTASPDSVVHVSTPTWANHAPLLSGSGLELQRYPYFDPATGGVQFDRMTAELERLPARAVVLLQAACHNPTGADLSPPQWRELLALVKRRQLLPFIDMAYQGLGDGLEADAYGLRLFCAELPEVLCAVSCSKNFGLYRERTGALHVVNETPAGADATFSQLVRIARGIWSMPPDHGAAIVHGILADAPLRTAWADEVAAMRQRIQGLRHAVVKQLRNTARSATSVSSPRSAACSPPRHRHRAGARVARPPSRLHDRRQPHEYRGPAPGEPRVLRARNRAGAGGLALRHDDPVRGLHFFHHEVGVGLLHAAHPSDAIPEEAAVTLHIRHAYLQQVIEPSRHHVTLHHFVVRQHHLLEALKGVGVVRSSNTST